uniref:DUF834 domain-containing protein n=1 Tax=Oryza barthii TaxID=65489 RepID=A0A0D3H410_9ORYZ
MAVTRSGGPQPHSDRIWCPGARDGGDEATGDLGRRVKEAATGAPGLLDPVVGLVDPAVLEGADAERGGGAATGGGGGEQPAAATGGGGAVEEEGRGGVEEGGRHLGLRLRGGRAPSGGDERPAVASLPDSHRSISRCCGGGARKERKRGEGERRRG